MMMVMMIMMIKIIMIMIMIMMGLVMMIFSLKVQNLIFFEETNNASPCFTSCSFQSDNQNLNFDKTMLLPTVLVRMMRMSMAVMMRMLQPIKSSCLPSTIKTLKRVFLKDVRTQTTTSPIIATSI